jgi:nucleoid-associated protein YgaU
MSILSFVKDAGERILSNAKAAVQLHPGSEEHQKPASVAPSSSSSPSSSTTDPAGEAIINYIRAQNLEVEDLQVRFDAATSTVQVSGTAKDQATKEKVVLCCGNIEGVEKVDDRLQVKQAAPEAQYHAVIQGETLSAIAKKHYGNANKYMTIFEANKPMLKDPNRIYPGQLLRIPQLS